MKKLNQFITEKLKLGKNNKVYNYHPNTRDELVNLLDKLIKERGNNANLNDIDVSKITDMSTIFYIINQKTIIGNINISLWNTSNVENMYGMFYGCKVFNCDLSEWDVSKVMNMENMFGFCTKFESDLSEWDISNVLNITNMFRNCKKFESDLNDWNTNKIISAFNWYQGCPYLENHLPKWNDDLMKNQ